MSNPLKLHQTNGTHAYVLQTHRRLMTECLPDLDIHPLHGSERSLQLIQQRYRLPHQPFFLQQVHGAEAIALHEPPSTHFWTSADACYTFQKNIVCAVMTADCLPVLITDSQTSFVAAVHCGWRSLYEGILTKILNKISTDNPLIVWFGPAICQNHYQVDQAFKNHYLKAHPTAAKAFTRVIDGHCYADIAIMARVQLQHFEVANLYFNERCTYEDPDYYSWRRNKTKARQASLIWMST